MSSELKRILLVSAGVFHPPYFGRQALRASLAQLKGFSFQHVRSLEHLPVNYQGLSALVLYYHARTISAAALERLDAFVRSGGGVLAVHSATASFKQEQHYFEILGGQFTGHGKVEDIEISAARDDITTAGVMPWRGLSNPAGWERCIPSASTSPGAARRATSTRQPGTRRLPRRAAAR